MYREIYDMARRNRLGYLVLGSSAEIFDEICQNSLWVIVMSAYGAELVRCGNIENEIVSRLLAETMAESAGKEFIQTSVWENYSVYQCHEEETGIIVYKIVGRVGWEELGNAVFYAPMALLVGFLIGLYLVLLLISNIVFKSLQTLRTAMDQFKQGGLQPEGGSRDTG